MDGNSIWRTIALQWKNNKYLVNQGRSNLMSYYYSSNNHKITTTRDSYCYQGFDNAGIYGSPSPKIRKKNINEDIDCSVGNWSDELSLEGGLKSKSIISYSHETYLSYREIRKKMANNSAQILSQNSIFNINSQQKIFDPNSNEYLNRMDKFSLTKEERQKKSAAYQQKQQQIIQMQKQKQKLFRLKKQKQKIRQMLQQQAQKTKQVFNKDEQIPQEEEAMLKEKSSQNVAKFPQKKQQPEKQKHQVKNNGEEAIQKLQSMNRIIYKGRVFELLQI